MSLERENTGRTEGGAAVAFVRRCFRAHGPVFSAFAVPSAVIGMLCWRLWRPLAWILEAAVFGFLAGWKFLAILNTPDPEGRKPDHD